MELLNAKVPKTADEAKAVVEAIHEIAPIPFTGESCADFYNHLQRSGKAGDVWCLLNLLYAWAGVADPRAFRDEE